MRGTSMGSEAIQAPREVFERHVLSRPDILKRIAARELVIGPLPAEEAIEQVSIDPRLGHIFSHFKPPRSMGAVRVTKGLFKDRSLWQDEE